MKTAAMSTSLVIMGLIAPMVEARTVEIVGTLQEVGGNSISGILTVFHSPPSASSESHEIEGGLQISIEAAGEMLVHVMAEGRVSEERIVAPEVTGRVTMRFRLPPRQDVRGRVVDQHGNGVPGTMIRAHCRVGGGAPQGWPPSAAQTARTVFP